jgi:transposase-like protein
MVHYDDPELFAVPQPPHICPKCGSHRTEVVGISDRGEVVLRCNACGERSTVVLKPMRYQPIGAGPSSGITIDLEH